MDKVYRRYVDSRGHNSISAIPCYSRKKEQDELGNYIQHKRWIRELYLNEQVEREQIEMVARKLIKAINIKL